MKHLLNRILDITTSYAEIGRAFTDLVVSSKALQAMQPEMLDQPHGLLLGLPLHAGGFEKWQALGEEGQNPLLVDLDAGGRLSFGVISKTV